MLIPARIAEAVRAGTVTTQYRRWDEPRVKVGGTHVTSAGVLRITRVTTVTDVDAITDRAARAAGVADAATLRKALAPRAPGQRGPASRTARGGAHVYRIHLEWVGEDPRLALRETLPDAPDLAAIKGRLDRLDARSSEAWTTEVLIWIRDHPRVLSAELARLRDVPLQPLKVDIRKLKALGLTISHDVGYELSPRGATYLRWAER